MRASTLFGVAIALFLGAAAVVAIRYTGVLERTPVAQEKVEPVMVLVARHNLFEGTAATPDDVVVREATPAERDYISRNRDKIMSPSVEAAALRIAARNIAVGEILQKDQFLDPMIPDPVSKRLEPGMRSVNVVLPKDRAAGGLIRVGEYVDVYLTSVICTDPKCTTFRTATAPLAQNLKVVIKRDSLWTMMQPVPEDKPVSFILQANAYRAALIELAKTKGILTLIPSGATGKDRGSLASIRLEETRAAAFLSGEAVVSDEDLERIFNLQPLQTPEPPLATEHYTGIKYAGKTVHDQQNSKIGTAPGYNFRMPGAQAGGAPIPQSAFRFNSQVPEEDKGCPTCGKGEGRK